MPTRHPVEPQTVTVAGRSSIGRIRSHNEDAYLVAALSDDGVVRKGCAETMVFEAAPTFLVVADGVGGAASGDIASLMATDALLIDLRRQYERGALDTVYQASRAMRSAVSGANYVINKYAAEHSRHYGMATTVTLAIIFGKSLLLAQVGDSRAYLIRNGATRQLTKDQSLVQQLVDAGELTETEAEQSDRRNVILQAIGFESVVSPDLYHEMLQTNDILVLCTDGLTTHVSPSEIAEIATTDSNIGAVCQRMVDLANERGGYDNITVVVARLDAQSLAPAKRITLGSKIREFWDHALRSPR